MQLNGLCSSSGATLVGDAGVQVPARDAVALAEAIADLLEDPARREALGAQGRARMESSFCWERSARRMVDYYREVLERADR